MPSKTSCSNTRCFSPTLFKHDLKRFWPLSLLVLVTVVLLPGTTILSVRNQVDYPSHLLPTVRDHFYNVGIPMVLLMACACLLTALVVFNYLQGKSKIRFFHGLPLSRNCTFLTSYLSGLVLILCPLLAGLLICWVFACIVGAPGVGGAILALLGAALACLLCFFSLAVLSCVLCGNPLGSILVYAALNFALMVILMGSSTLVGQLMPGIDIENLLNGPLGWLIPLSNCAQAVQPVYSEPSPVDYFSYIIGFEHPWCLVAYGVAGIALAFLAAWIYRIRRDETAGETVSFRAVRSVCKVLFALVFSGAGAVLVVEASNTGSPLSVSLLLAIHLVFAILGWFIAEMIVRRTLRVVNRRSLISCAILVLVLLLLAGLARADLFGVVRRVPQAQEVERVTVEYDYTAMEVEAEDATALHRDLLRYRGLLGTEGSFALYKDTRPLQIYYTLENGRQLHRSYLVMDAGTGNEVEALMVQFLKDPAYAHQYWFGGIPQGDIAQDNLVSGGVYYDPDSLSVDSEAEVDGTVASLEVEDNSVYFELDADEAYQLYQAILADLEQGVLDADSNWNGGVSYGWVEFCYKAPRDGEDEGLRGPGAIHEDGTTWVSLTVWSGMEHTLAWIEDAAARHPSSQLMAKG